jgi:hypothetical protein
MGSVEMSEGAVGNVGVWEWTVGECRSGQCGCVGVGNVEASKWAVWECLNGQCRNFLVGSVEVFE